LGINKRGQKRINGGDDGDDNNSYND